MEKVMPFEKCPYYTQESKGDVKYQTILPKGEMGQLSMGYVRLQGPAETMSNTHTEWRQAYIVISGSGTVILEGEKYKVKAPSIVKIPPGTDHMVMVSSGEEMKYVYVNEFLD